jgi:hypothetical protein
VVHAPSRVAHALGVHHEAVAQIKEVRGLSPGGTIYLVFTQNLARVLPHELPLGRGLLQILCNPRYIGSRPFIDTILY